jgi:hypothetical protein
MKRGRPSKRANIKKAIITLLEKSKVPLTTSSISKLIAEESNIPASWNTVQKYIRELLETNHIQSITLPHSKKSGETGLVVYALKK